MSRENELCYPAIVTNETKTNFLSLGNHIKTCYFKKLTFLCPHKKIIAHLRYLMITKYRVVTTRKERCYPEMIKTMLKQKQNLDVFLPKQGFFSLTLSLSFSINYSFVCPTPNSTVTFGRNHTGWICLIWAHSFINTFATWLRTSDLQWWTWRVRVCV